MSYGADPEQTHGSGEGGKTQDPHPMIPIPGVKTLSLFKNNLRWQLYLKVKKCLKKCSAALKFKVTLFDNVGSLHSFAQWYENSDKLNCPIYLTTIPNYNLHFNSHLYLVDVEILVWSIPTSTLEYKVGILSVNLR